MERLWLANHLCARCRGCDSLQGCGEEAMDKAVDTLLEELKAKAKPDSAG